MKKIICNILIFLLLGVIAFCGYKLYSEYLESKKQNEQFKHTISEINKDKPKTFFDKYKKLLRKNSDMIGWIKIDGTRINYPVMQSKGDPDFYLKHNFNKEYSIYGVPYIPKGCNVKKPSDNITICGHNMKDGSMFAGLEKYKDKDFYNSHSIIKFDTIAGFGKYEVIAVFKTNPYAFQYYQFIDAKGKSEFNGYVRKCKSLSLYDTGKTAEYGDKLISLSTCEYSGYDNRLVVVARKIVN